MTRDAGSATLWLLAFCALVLGVATATTIRTAAVLTRHRAESAADLAALAAAAHIGVAPDVCDFAATAAQANAARLLSCRSQLAADGRSGDVTVRVGMDARLPVVGSRLVIASARAGRDPPGR